MSDTPNIEATKEKRAYACGLAAHNRVLGCADKTPALYKKASAAQEARLARRAAISAAIFPQKAEATA